MAAFMFMKLNLLLVLIISLSCTITQARVPPPSTAPMGYVVNRLKLDEAGSSANCWASLMELQACTGEVIQFFYDGETYLGPACCRAIHVIEHQCWPAMLTALGFTSEEGDILRGYCDSEEENNKLGG